MVINSENVTSGTTRTKNCLKYLEANMPYLWDACRPCWLWSSVLEEEDGNSPLATELDKVAALESSIMSQLPIVGHYPHQVPTEQTWTVGLHGLRGFFQPQQFHDSPFWTLEMIGMV